MCHTVNEMQCECVFVCALLERAREGVNEVIYSYSGTVCMD